MTKPTSAPCNDARRGFTLTELLVVIGIIVLLVGLLTPMISRAYREGERARVKGDLQTIGTALEAFKQDHGNYPPGGAVNLVRWLISPGDDGDVDGANDHDANTNPDPGFRLRAGAGKVWGPYLQMDKWKMDPTGTMLIDRYGRPVLYYLANLKAPVHLPNRYISDDPAHKPRYDASQNLTDASGNGLMPLEPLQWMLGDVNLNKQLDSAETGVSLPFLLISAGPDELYGPQADISGSPTAIDGTDVQKCDDVTNFK